MLIYATWTDQAHPVAPTLARLDDDQLERHFANLEAERAALAFTSETAAEATYSRLMRVVYREICLRAIPTIGDPRPDGEVTESEMRALWGDR